MLTFWDKGLNVSQCHQIQTVHQHFLPPSSLFHQQLSSSVLKAVSCGRLLFLGSRFSGSLHPCSGQNSFVWKTETLSPSAWGCSTSLTGYSNKKWPAWVNGTEFLLFFLLGWSVLKYRVGQTSAAFWNIATSPLDKSWGCRHRAWLHYQSSVFGTRIPLYSERMVQTTKQVSSHWLFWKLKSSKILVVIILQKKDFWLLKRLPRAILCLPCCYDKHQGRKKSAPYRRETVSYPPFKSESPRIKAEPSKSFRKTVLFYIRAEFSSKSLAKTFKGSKRDGKTRTTQGHCGGTRRTDKSLLFFPGCSKVV